MKQFTILWFGQLVSTLGSSMTRFALILWIYTQTGDVTATALLGFFSMLPYVMISPFAGFIVDKYSRKKVLLISDFGSALGTLTLLLMLYTNQMALWMIYFTMIVSGLCDAFQTPAMNASITLMMPKDRYARANAMRSFAGNASRMTAPVIAGALIGIIGMKGIILIDFITFFVGITSLAMVTIPNPEGQEVRRETKMTVRSFIRSYEETFIHLKSIPGLILLLVLFAAINLITGMTYYGIFPAYILARSQNNSVVLGIVETMLGLGGIVGSMLVGTLKIKKRKMNIILGGLLLSYLCGDFLLAIGKNVYIWSIAVFSTSILIAFVITYENVIWQQKIKADVQGKAFAFRGTVCTLAMQAGYLAGGLLADHVFEPLAIHRELPGFITKIVGDSAGSGMAMMFLISTVLGVFFSFLGFFSSRLRSLDEI